jgi:hypothetical protein
MILIIIITFLIIYFIHKFIQDYKTIEKFSTQSSLSTYFSNTVDSDDYMKNSNSLQHPYIDTNQSPFIWNGIWQNVDIPIISQFLQINDKIIVVLSNTNFSEIYSNNDIQSNDTCNNMFIGIGQLNSKRNSFYITKVLCNMYNNNVLGIGPNNLNNLPESTIYFSGTIVKGNIILTSNNTNNTNNLWLALKEKYPESINIEKFPHIKSYLHQISKFVHLNPSAAKSNYEFSICPTNSIPCINSINGLNTDSVNACGTIDKGTNNTCNNNVTCYINPPSNSNLPICQPQINKYLNFNALGISMNSDDETNLNLCDYLSNFSSSYCNAVILCYISNIGNVQTLNYQFFGTMPNESSLNTQYDMMNNILNNNSNTNLQKYRNLINSVNASAVPTDSSQLKPLLNGISFTNCLTSSSIWYTNILISGCSNTCKNYIKNYSPSNSNNNLNPCVWQINVNNKYNLLNSCGFTLSTFKGYNSPTKYVQCNNNGTVNLSLYGDGLDQTLYFDSINILTDTDKRPNPPFVAMTANIRSNSGSYLIPDSAFGGLMNNTNKVILKNNPEPNSKWLILGFSLNSLNNLSSLINSFNF